MESNEVFLPKDFLLLNHESNDPLDIVDPLGLKALVGIPSQNTLRVPMRTNSADLPILDTSNSPTSPTILNGSTGKVNFNEANSFAPGLSLNQDKSELPLLDRDLLTGGGENALLVGDFNDDPVTGSTSHQTTSSQNLDNHLFGIPSNSTIANEGATTTSNSEFDSVTQSASSRYIDPNTGLSDGERLNDDTKTWEMLEIFRQSEIDRLGNLGIDPTTLENLKQIRLQLVDLAKQPPNPQLREAIARQLENLIDLKYPLSGNEYDWLTNAFLPFGVRHVPESEDSINTLSSVSAREAGEEQTLISGVDLTVTDAQAPETAALNETIKVSWEVTNRGDTDITGSGYGSSWYDAIYLSDDTKLDVQTYESGGVTLRTDNLLTNDTELDINTNPNTTASLRTDYLLTNDTSSEESDTSLTSYWQGERIPLKANQSYTQPERSIKIPNNAKAGSRYLLFVTDVYNYQTEAEETNNVLALPIQIQAPDLVVSATTAPPSATIGQAIEVDWTVTNQGTAALGSGSAGYSNYWYDEVWLSSDPEFDRQTDINLGYQETSRLTQLAVGESYTTPTREIFLPATAAKTYYLLFVADPWNNQSETDETNNIRRVEINLTAPPIVGTISAVDGTASGTLSEDDSANPTYWGSKSDDYQLTNFTVGKSVTLELSSTDFNTYLQVIDTDTQQVIASSESGANLSAQLSSGQENTNSVQTQQALASNYYFNSDNKSLLSFTPVEGINYTVRVTSYNSDATGDYILKAGLPELAITAATVTPVTTTPSGIVDVSWTVTNQGHVAASTDWYDAIYLSKDNVFDWETDTLIKEYPSREQQRLLSNGESYTYTDKISLLQDVSIDTNYYLLFVTNTYADKEEGSKTNNVWASAIEIVKAVPPKVINSSITDGDVLNVGAVDYQVKFSKPMSTTTGLGAEDVTLFNSVSGTYNRPESFAYNQDTNTATVSYNNLPEGIYTLKLLSSPTAFRDSTGPLLDGASDGGTSDFVVNFNVDAANREFPVPLSSKRPQGSLIYDTSTSGVFHSTDDTDTFSVELDAGQTATLLLMPQNDTIQGKVELFGPDSLSLGVATASSVGIGTILQTLPVAVAGKYRVDATSLAGTGQYKVQIILNAATESESLLGEDNDSIAKAQNIDASSVSLQDTANRLAVIGQTGGDDYYSFTLAEGEKATLVLTSQNGGNVDLELWDASNVLLSGGVEEANNVNEYISGFVAPTAGTYYARVSGTAQQQYSLIVTRNADFEIEKPLDEHQDVILAPDSIILGSVGRGSQKTNQLRLGLIQDRLPWSSASNNEIATQLGYATTVIPSSSLPTADLSVYDILLLAGDQNLTTYSNVANNMSRIETYVAEGGVWLVNDAPSDVELQYSYDLLPGANLVSIVARWGANVDILAPASGLIIGAGGTITNTNLDGGSSVLGYTSSLLPADATAILSNGNPTQVVAFDYPFGDGHVVIHTLPVEAYDGGLYGIGSVFHRNLLDFGSKLSVDIDNYFLSVSSGDQLNIQTTTPGGSFGEPVNTLDPRIKLYDEYGELVATDDNSAADGKNALLNYTVPSGSTGAYKVSVQPVSGTGDYTLAVGGATGAAPAFEVIATTSGDGTLLSAYPNKYRIDFSQALLLPSINPSDLLVNGTPAGSFTIIDQDTLEFDISSANTGDGTYTVTVAPGVVTSLSGQEVAAFSTTFVTDTTPPTVIHSSIGDLELLAVGSVTYQVQFSEAMSATGLDASDVTLLDSVSGTNYRPESFAYNQDTNTATISYSNLPEGIYTLKLLSSPTAFRDLAGLALDGAGNGGGSDFVLNFGVDAANQELPVPLSSKQPQGSLIYDTSTTGVFHATDDTDTFSVELEAGQTATLLLMPQDNEIQGKVELFGPDSLSLGVATASSVGIGTILQTLPVAVAGKYLIDATSLAGTGQYKVQMILNAATENESLLGEDNDSIAKAQNIDVSSVSLQDTANRLAVIGQTGGDDYYSFTLAEGEKATLVLTSQNGGNVDLELWDASNVLLSGGVEEANNVNEYISGFVAPTAGTYYARVSGTAEQQYSLIVTRNADFEIEKPLDEHQGDILAPSSIILGRVGRGSQKTNQLRLGLIQDQLPWGRASNNEIAIELGYATTVIPSFSLPTVDLSVYDILLLAGDQDWSTYSNVANNMSRIETYVAEGGVWLVNDAASSMWLPYSYDLLPGANLVSIVSSGGANVDVLAPASGLIIGAGGTITNTNLDVGTSSVHGYTSSLLPAGATTILSNGNPTQVVAFDYPFGDGYVVVHTLPVEYYNGGPHGIGSVFHRNLLDFGSKLSIDIDNYFLSVSSGNQLNIQTTTPGGSIGEPVNTLDPLIKLYDENGELVATDDNSAADGKNALLSYTVPSDSSGTYKVLVEAASGTGDYTLAVGGATGAAPAFEAVAATPANAALLTAYPNKYRIDFSQKLLLSSINNSDLLINGTPASSVTIIDQDTLEFDISTANKGDGLYNLAIASGALTSLSGTPLSLFSASFDIESTNPRVITSSIGEGDTIAPGKLVYQVQFSELMAIENLDSEDVTLVDNLTGYNFTPYNFSYDPDTNTATITYFNLDESDYTLSLLTSATAFRDRRGNLLDGGQSFSLPSGDGFPGDPFVVNFRVDNTSQAWAAPLYAILPVGSLSFESYQRGNFNASNDVDTFTIDVDSGQTITIDLRPWELETVAQVELFAPDGTSLGVASATTAGQSVLLSMPLKSAGTYSFSLSSLAGSGNYGVEVVLNSGLETEEYGSSSNNTIATAQNLDTSSVGLQGSANRLAVLGYSESDDDLYAFTLAAGEIATMVLTSLYDSNIINLELLAPDSRVLAIGLEAANNDNYISNFVAPAAGTYYVRVSSEVGQSYNLVVTRGADFNLEPNNTTSQSQLLIGSQALGELDAPLRIEPDDFTDGTNFIDVPNVFLWAPGFFASITAQTSSLRSTGTSVFSLNGDVEWYGSKQLRADFDHLTSSVSIDIIGDDPNDRGILQAYDVNDVLLQEVISPWETGNQPYTLTINRANRDIAYIKASGYSSSVNLDNLVISGDDADYYSIQATSGDRLEISTTTPGGGSGVPDNTLAPRLELYNEFGVLISSNERGASDGQNAQISYTVPSDSSGSYTIRLSGEERGAYTLAVTGVTPSSGPAPRVTATTIAANQILKTLPTEIDFTLSEAVRVDSLAATDLLLDGGAEVTGVELVDARTVRFLITVPDVDGTITYSLPAGAFSDLQAQPSSEYQANFTIDRNGPRVVTSSPAVSTTAPLSEIVFDFNEQINSSTFTQADIVSFTSPAGTNLLDQIINVSGEGKNFKVTFQPQVTQGTYTMAIGPNIEDVAGSLMDQDSDRLSGESDDFFTATVELQLPDLVVSEVEALKTAQLSETIKIDWSVTNQGSGTAVADWYDEVYLSGDDTLDLDNSSSEKDLLLLSQATGNQTPLEHNSSYNFTSKITLPSDDKFAGDRYLIVVTNRDNKQAETKDDNNYLAVPITLLAPVDLVVSKVTAPPLTIGDPATVTIGWEVTNEGQSSSKDKSWVDRIVASPDDTLGNGNDVILASFTHTEELTANQSYTRSETFLLPPAFQGRYRLFVQTDATNAVFENTQEANNALDATNFFDVIRKPYADLVIPSVTTDSTASSGQPLRVSWSVTNTGIGTTSTSSWSDSIQLATDPQGKNIVANLGSFEHVGALAKDGSYNRTVDVNLPNGISGTYYLVVKTGGPEEFIYTDNNSRVSAPVDVVLSPPVDIVVTDITAPTEVLSGDKIDIAWQVRNFGLGNAAPTWVDTVFLQKAGNPEEIVQLGSFTYSNELGAGKFYKRSEQFTLPTTISGEYHVFVTTNASKSLYEHGGADNNTVKDDKLMSVSLAPRPDLQVQEITPSQNIKAGDNISVDFIVVNQGTVATTAPTWQDNVYLSLDDKISSDDLLLGSLNNNAALDKGGSYRSSTLPFTVPKRFGGPMYVLVETDANKQVDEFPQENNNVLSVRVNVESIPKSDLVTSDVVAPDQAFEGQQIKVSYKVTNKGVGETDRNDWTDTIWLTRDRDRPAPVTGQNPPQPNDILLATFPHSGALAINQNYEQSVTVTLPKQVTGEWYITPWTDSYSVVVEETLDININSDDSDELDNNNYKARPITILLEPPPDLVVTSVVPTATANAGEAFSVTWTVQNSGAKTSDSTWIDAVYLSDSPTLGTPGAKEWLLGRVERNGSLDGSQSYTQTLNTILSPAAAGQYVIVETNSTKTDGSRAWEGSYTTNNTRNAVTNVTNAPADLVVTSVKTPIQNFSGERASIEWTVQNVGGSVWSGTRYWYDEVWISPDPKFIPNRATNLGSFIYSPQQSLGAGSSYTQVQEVTLPRGINGSYYIYVKSNTSGELPDKGDNELSRTSFEERVFENPSNNLTRL